MRRRRGDQRGTASLSELLVVMVVGGMALMMATTLFLTLLKVSSSTTNKVTAEMQVRDSLRDSMRYLRNAAPLGSCAQWDSSFALPSASGGLDGNAILDSAASHCLRVNNDTPALRIAQPTHLQFYAYANASGAGSGSAPDILDFVITPSSVPSDPGTLTVTRHPATASVSVFAAQCAALVAVDPTLQCKDEYWVYGMPTPAHQVAFGGVWNTFPNNGTQVASIPIQNGSSFTFLDASGGAWNGSNISDVRLVSVNLSANYKDSNNQLATFAFRATVSLRGAQYAGSQS